MNPEYKIFEEQVFFSTLRIGRPGNKSMGTGFLVEVPSCIKGKKYIFLISNKHVLDDPKKETLLSLHLKDSKGNPKLGDVFPLKITAFKEGYYYPDMPEIDLALFNVSELINLTKEKTGKDVYYRSLNIDIFSNYKEKI